MSRIFITVDESDPSYPIPELHVNGGILKMSERELLRLIEEAQWASGVMAGVRATHWANLASKHGWSKEND